MRFRLSIGSLYLFVQTFIFSHPGPVLASEGFPPQHPYLAPSAWPMIHGNSYNQDASPLAGPAAGGAGRIRYAFDTVAGDPVSITVALSGAYFDGTVLAWGNTKSFVYKMQMRPDGLRAIETFRRGTPAATELSGAYALVDHLNRFIVPRDFWIDFYDNLRPADPRSGITESSVNIGGQLADAGASERIVGMSMTWDGFLALATNTCRLVVTDRVGLVRASVRLGTGSCDVSNTIAVDESGGIFVATNQNVQRWDWLGESLVQRWLVPYESEDFFAPGRLGKGTGTSPTLMGNADATDQFVVITDGMERMNIVLIWRGDIPDDWEGLPGQDRRVAAVMPVRFGKGKPAQAVTEQSIVVMGHSAVVVDNSYGYVGRLAENIARRRGHDLNRATIYLSSTRGVAPYGVEKFDWMPAQRRLQSAWARSDISCPNGVPVASAASDLFYCIGQRNAVWNVEALRWSSGRTAFYLPLGRDNFFNSFYAGLQVGPFGNLLTGTFGGFLNIRGFPE